METHGKRQQIIWITGGVAEAPNYNTLGLTLEKMRRTHIHVITFCSEG